MINFRWSFGIVVILVILQHTAQGQGDNLTQNNCTTHCQNGGTCTTLRQEPSTCLCPIGFAGPFCEIKNDNVSFNVAGNTRVVKSHCSLVPCMNSGICERNGRCHCDKNHSGKFCEQKVAALHLRQLPSFTYCNGEQDILCHNGGTCVKTAPSNYQCLCPPNFSGVSCEIRTETTEELCLVDEDCAEGQICKSNGSCQCPPGYGGPKCTEATVVSFYGDSLFAYLIPIDLRHPELEFSLEFHFRTALFDTILAIGESIFGKEFCLMLINYKVSLYVGKKRLINSDYRLNENDWYKLDLKINFTSNLAYLTIHNSENIVYSSTMTIERRLRMSPIFVTKFGGVGEIFLDDEPVYEPFVGCLFDIFVNGLLIYPKQFKGSSAVNIGYECKISKRYLCDNNRCSGHGFCKDLLLKSVCHCDRPYYGNNCEAVIQEATFGHETNRSYAEIILSSADSQLLSRNFNISFFIKTRQRNGTLIYMGNRIDQAFTKNPFNNFILIEIENYRLGIKIKRTGQILQNIVNSTSHKLDVGFETFLNIEIGRDVVSGRLNSTLIFNQEVGYGLVYPPTINHFYIGGYPDPIRRIKRFTYALEKLAPYFKGTFRDIRINNQIIELFSENMATKNLQYFGAALLHNNVIPGTLSDETCKSQPCFHEGTCHVTFNDFICRCKAGYFGKKCQFKDYCYFDSCSTEASCINLESKSLCTIPGTFNSPNSLLDFTLLSENHDQLFEIAEIRFDLRTRTLEGHVLSVVDQSNVLIIQFLISKGRLTLLSFDNGTQNHAAAYFFVSNGNWQSVSLNLRKQSHLVVDQQKIELPFLPVVLLPQTVKFIFGGQYGLGFDGCVNGAKLLLENKIEYGTFDPPYDDDLTNIVLEIPFVISSNVDNYKIKMFHVTVQQYDIAEGCVGKDVCRDSLCKNDATCIDTFNSYRCQCTAGFNGSYCQVNIDDCADHACQNNGTCEDKTSGYLCHCAAGLTGSYCENQINDCISSTCQNGGTCMDLTNDYVCHCDINFTGRHCETSLIIDCQSGPCLHGGTCLEAHNWQNGTKRSSVICHCHSIFFGEFCEQEIDVCRDVTCEHNGSCLADIRSKNFTCLCLEGYAGQYCDVNIDECANHSCVFGTCVDKISGYGCHCQSGWGGPYCDLDIDECLDYPCVNGGLCENLPGNFTCRCPQYHFGPFCEVEGSCLRKPCLHGQCRQMEPIDYVCDCLYGYSGLSCDTEVDYCHPNPCLNFGTCSKNSTNFTCHCLTEFKGNHCEFNKDACNSHPCFHGSKCFETDSGYSCTCDETGFTGPSCSVDVDECLVPSFCRNGACSNFAGGYNCTCYDGYKGAKCDQVDTCASNNKTWSCENGGQCLIWLNSSSIGCQCLDGYFGDRCQHQNYSPFFNKSGFLLYIGVPSAALGLFIFTVACIMVLLTIKSNRATRGKYSPSRQELSGVRLRFGPMIKPPPEERLI